MLKIWLAISEKWSEIGQWLAVILYSDTVRVLLCGMCLYRDFVYTCVTVSLCVCGCVSGA